MAPAENRLVVGTAGHIDHGKTALIRALTGIDTDRLPEEKERGITIELGFAPLDLGAGLRVSVVDVPGHEGLVRTMVAGATGIDLVLLVIAADEGVMPQTREHVAICELLGIHRGVVALTKIDATEPDVVELAGEEAIELLADTGLAGSPLVRVSASTGAGVEELRRRLFEVITGSEPRTPRSGPPRLSIDRCFAAKGFGCVVTGTLVGSAFAVGDHVEIQPPGLRGRVRGLQNHGVAAERSEPGARCAINLQGIEVLQVSRGQVVTAPDALDPTRILDVKLQWLDVAPATRDPASVEFLTGTAERRARLAPIGAGFRPGGVGFARLHVEGEPVPALPGDRFIVRGFARTEMGGATLGGGVILDVAPPHRRRSDPALASELTELSRREPQLDLLVRIRRGGLAGIREDRLRRETGLDADSLATALSRLAEKRNAVVTSNRTWLGPDAVSVLEKRLEDVLDAYHASKPIRPGMPVGALRGQLPENVPADAIELVIERLVERRSIQLDGDVARRRDHRPRIGSEERLLLERILREARDAGLEPPSEREWAERLRITQERLQDLLAHLKRDGRLVRARGDLWFDATAIAALRERILAYFETHERLDTPAYKVLIGTTRRTAVPLMEYFDDENLTLRSGDARILRAK